MSIADGMPPAVLLPADPDFQKSRDREARDNYLRRGAIAAAALAHVAVIAAMIIHWPNLFPARSLERPPIPVTLVTLPPPSPPQAQPAPPPPPPSQPFHDRVSGPDTKTTAPQQAVEKAEEAAPKPTPPPPTDAQANAAAPESKPPPPHEEKSTQEKPKVAKREAAPKPVQKSVFANRAIGETEREGDPYLNELYASIEQHRTYPRNAVGPLGLPLQGVGTYIVKVGNDGRILDMQIQRSAGAEILDQTALKMISSAGPFPQLPGNYPHPLYLYVTLPIFPGVP
jgi:protein TonB